MEKSFDFPTEVVELPSKGLVYPEDSALSSGKVEMKYMTAREEDILTNQNYIANGTVIDRLLKALIVSDIEYDELVVGDKNAVLLASRILGYGKDYEVQYGSKKYNIDLTTIESKPIDETLFTKGKNEFDFTLPASNVKVTFKLLDNKDEKAIEAELEGYKKIDKDHIPELSTRLKFIITSVDGDNSKKKINEFVDKYLLARDSRALREYINKVQPDVNAVFYPDGGPVGGVKIPFGISFLWPDSGI